MAEASNNRLRLLVERIERLREEKHGIEQDIRDVFAEAKAVGYDTKILRLVLARRVMKPDDRAEVDVMVETYEAALGEPSAAPLEAELAARAADERREMATAILAEQIEGIQDPRHAERLVEHLSVVLDIRAEIAGLREMERDRIKLAEHDGFQPKPLKALVRWIEQCAKKGAEAMRAGEALFQLYRGTFEARGLLASPGDNTKQISADPALQRLAKRPGGRVAAALAWAEDDE